MNKKRLITISIVIIVSIWGCKDKKNIIKDSNNTNKIDINSTQIEDKKESNQTKPFIKKYDIKSGIIRYKVKGIGDVNSTGRRDLIFKNYGSLEISKGNITETRLENNKTVKRDVNITIYNKDAVIYAINYNDKTIMRRPNPILSMIDINQQKEPLSIELLKNSDYAQKIGKDKVLGYNCDVWQVQNSKECLYKGIILKIETINPNSKISEVATKIEFDVDIDKKEFNLPSNFSLIGLNVDKKDLNKLDEEEKKEVIESSKLIEKSDMNLSKEKRDEIIDKTIDESNLSLNELEEQKELIPKILKVMKSYKKCLIKTKSQKDANKCEDNIEKIAKELGLEEQFSQNEQDEFIWNEENKEKELGDITEAIKSYETIFPCVKKAKTLKELKACNQ